MRYNKFLALLMGSAALVASSCQKENEPDDPGKKPQTGEFAYSFKPVTADFSKTFVTGEKIGLHIPAAELVTTAEVGADGKITVKLEKELSAMDNVCGFIPADAKVSDGVAAFEIPASQKSGSSFSTDVVPFVAVPAASNAGEMKFIALTSALRFKVTSANPETEKVQSVKFETVSALAGNFRLSLPVVDAEIPVTYAVSGHEGKTVTVDVDGEAVAGTSAAEIYMVVAPGSYNGKATVVTDKGSYEFELSGVKAERASVADVELAIKVPAKSLPLDTEVLYNVCDMDGKVLKERTYVVSKDDFDNGKNHASAFTDASIKDYFATVEDPNVFLLYGYVESGKYEYGYTSIAARVLDEDDAAHAGCKVVEILSSCISAEPLAWDGYTQTVGTGWYDPAAGTVTIENCKGHLGWGYDFNWNRVYKPADDIALSSTSVSVPVGAERTVEVIYANGEFTAVSAAPSVASVSVAEKVITISGVAAGETAVTVTDSKGKTAEIAVTVKAPSNGIPTDILYDITLFEDDTDYSSSYKPTFVEREVKGVYICSREDYLAKTSNSDVFYSAKDPWIVKNYFAKYTDDDIIMMGGYISSDKKANYGYLAIAIQLTSETVADGEFAGCKVVKVLHSVPSASEADDLSWFKSNGYESHEGTAYFNPKDGSITIAPVQGKHDKKDFVIHRKYTPAE